MAGNLFPALPGIPCLIKLWTGWECVGCGLTRGCRALLRGELAATWAFNPLTFFVAGYCVLRLLRALSAVAMGREWPGPLPRQLSNGVQAAFLLTGAWVLYLRILHPR